MAHCDSNDNVFYVNEVKISSFSCDKSGHKRLQCPENKSKEKPNRWCDNCRRNSHDMSYCRNKNSSRYAAEKNEAFQGVNFYILIVSVNENSVKYVGDPIFLVDCGALSQRRTFRPPPSQK